ncbi:MAG: hypothetical protein A2W28_11000 [Gammaproteobacteria bacterium RBG_16_51_14]|nr:MAG: hypothetical protein A2W28_11000 [Gammaproteobacteria bacterium RBG_16_51_14]
MLSKILNTTPDSVMISRRGDGRIMYVNPAFTRMLKYTEEEAIGKTISELDLWISKKERKTLLSKLDETSKVNDFEAEFYTRDNKILPGSLAATYIELDGEKCVLSVVHDITGRRQVQEAIRRAYHIQQALAEIMRISLQPLTLQETLVRALDIVLSSPTFCMLKEGALFVTREDGNTLELVAHYNLAEPLQTACARLPFGKCLCGRAAASREILFVDHVDESHEISYEGIQPHGHYCVPILFGERVLGVLNTYVDAGYARKAEDEQFLKAIAQTLALTIEHKRTEQSLQKSEAQLSKIFNATPDAVTISRLEDGLFYYINPAFTSMFKYTPEETLGQTVSSLNLWVHPEDRVNMVRELDKVGEVTGFESEIRSKEGNTLSVFISACKIEMEGETCLVTTSRDITERRKLEEQYRFTRFSVEHTGDALFWIEPDARIFYVNDAACNSLGYPRDELTAMSVMDIDPDFSEGRWRQAWLELKTKKNLKLESIHRRKDGTIFPVEIKANFLEYGGKEYNFAFVQDITIRKQAEEMIKHLAHHDLLTGLPNRTLFMDRLEHAIARCRRDETMLAVMFLDLDNFKPINDSLGHATGDQILKQIAEKLASCMRQTDTLARFGGDEFIALMTDLKSTEAPAQMAEKLNMMISEPFSLGTNEFLLGASIGIALYPEHAHTSERLILLADKAMYEAKSRRKVYQFADSSI